MQCDATQHYQFCRSVTVAIDNTIINRWLVTEAEAGESGSKKKKKTPNQGGRIPVSDEASKEQSLGRRRGCGRAIVIVTSIQSVLQ